MQVDPEERPKAKYLVCGQLNLDKSDIYQRDFLQYLHSLSTHFRLTAYGDVGPGMEIFGFVAREKRQNQLLPLKKHAFHHAKKSRGNPQPYNIHTYLSSSTCYIHKLTFELCTVSNIFHNLSLCILPVAA